MCVLKDSQLIYIHKEMASLKYGYDFKNVLNYAKV